MRKDFNIYTLVSNQSLSSSFTTAPTITTTTDNVSYQINVNTTDSIGTFTVQASDDYLAAPGGSVLNAGEWVNLTLGGGVPFANAANDVISISLNQVPFVALRLVYTSTTAGTGTCSITVVSKQLGG